MMNMIDQFTSREWFTAVALAPSQAAGRANAG
jgi:hypothetical protein